MNLSEKTTVPLFSILGAGVVIAGIIIWAVGSSSKAEAKNVEQDARLDRQSAYIQKIESEHKTMLIEIRDRTIRTEEAVNILLKRSR